MPTRPAAATSRDSRLDVVRGLAIVAIVLVHVCRGMNNAGLLPVQYPDTVDRAVGMWCLSVFAFVGGTFVPRGVAQRGVGHYVRDRATRFAVIYVMWAILQSGVILAATSLVNLPTSFGAMFMLWHTPSQLWYLPFLVVVTLVFVPLRPWQRRRAPLVLAAAVVLSIAFWGYDGGYVGTQGLGLAVFFVAGMVCGGDRVRAALDRVGAPAAAAVGLSVLAAASIAAVATHATVVTVFFSERTAATVTAGIVLTVLASAAVLLLSQALAPSRALALLGRRSLDIYLAHIIMASGTRIVLMHLGVTSTWAIFTCCMVAGVVGSLVVATAVRRVGGGWLFDGPAWITRRRAPRTTPSAAAPVPAAG